MRRHKKKEAVVASSWLRGSDSNGRPPGYEPGELPTAPPRDISCLRVQRYVDFLDCPNVLPEKCFSTYKIAAKMAQSVKFVQKVERFLHNIIELC